MSTAAKEIVIVDEWRGLYSESWKGVICDEAFQHPAKFSRALIRKIYDHVIAEGWATKGSSVVDPFGGVALGGFDAMRHGLQWYGCELEAKFVELGGKNIALWNERFSRMPNWGTARLIQGDSRQLSDVLSVDVDACVSSPPFANSHGEDKHYGILRHERGCGCNFCKKNVGNAGANQSYKDFHAEASEGQLGAMKEGDHSIAISSPPYANDTVNDRNGIDQSKVKKPGGRNSQSRTMSGYGEASGQLGNLAVTSPPYNPPMSQDHNGTRGGSRGTTPSEKGAFVKYGNSEGQLEGMSMDGFNAAVSSPPYEGIQVGTGSDERKGWRGMTDHAGGTYANEAQLSAQPPETFWSASRLILEQLHQVLTPNAHAVFVVKAFVRDKKIVDFPAQWAQLCEAVGFKLLHDHHALLTEHYGTQGGFESDKTLSVERKSFFRRLAESKGSPRIDYENVLCFRKAA